ncbi:MAG: lipopolysaccharide heptosyltransferase [Solimicrobium sp.]|jgi:heptosyltransferase-2|nr:lipopolysaccharide heptosyltransferase [Solimicrobium sp.]
MLHPKKILVIGPAWVGDMVLAQSLFKTLKLQSPDCTINVAAPTWTLPLIERMPEVSQGIALPFKHGQLALLERIKFGKSMRAQAYTQAIILTNSFKSAILPFFANIPQRTSFAGEMRYGLINDIRPLDKKKLPRTVDRFVALGLPAGATLPGKIPSPALTSSKGSAIAALQALGLEIPEVKILGLCPGAEYGEAKRWPAEYYADVANAALKSGWQVWLFGSGKDVTVTTKINQLAQQKCVDLGGKTTLRDAIDLLSLCEAVVSNDSGLMHIAAALDKKLVAIYGSSNPHHTPPMNSQAVVKYLGLKCSPCFKRVCPLIHTNCLKQIPSNLVIADIKLFPDPIKFEAC